MSFSSLGCKVKLKFELSQNSELQRFKLNRFYFIKVGNKSFGGVVKFKHFGQWQQIKIAFTTK
jgi:hypothetical protein